MRNLIFFLPVLIYFGCSSSQPPAATPPPPSVPVATIGTTSATTFSEYPASIEGKVNVAIRPQVDGYLERVFVDEGAYVTAGQNLFKIDDRPFREQYNNALANLHAAKAAQERAKLEVDKIKPLVDNKVVSDVQLKTATAAYQSATALAEQAKASVAAAQINMDYTLIKAPVSGYVGRLPLKQGSLVSRAAAQELTMLTDIHEVYVYFALGEADFIRFKNQYKGNTLDEKIKNIPGVSLVLADDNEYPQQGKIDMVDGAFDKTTGAITLRASFPNKEGLLRSGNTGKIKLGLEHSNSIVVPQAATIEMQDKVFVVTVGDSNKVFRKPITIIGKSGNDYLVSDGVKAGDRIVLQGLETLPEGTVIAPAKPPVAQAETK